MAVLSGRTVVGGLIGGTLAVVLARRLLGLRGRSGNLFAPALALAIAIGRLGCFCAGCCHGVPSALPWAVDFGDGVPRHPTQLYESLFALGLFFALRRAEGRAPAPGTLFRAFMLAYFSFRFLVEFLRTDVPFIAGLTLAQVASLGVLGYYLLTWRSFSLREETSDDRGTATATTRTAVDSAASAGAAPADGGGARRAR
jgi:phosphatidylglycerol:prolipoprotein diacylglycerol transferase